jgi:uncharacterized protein YktA (UPF0223 family)
MSAAANLSQQNLSWTSANLIQAMSPEGVHRMQILGSYHAIVAVVTNTAVELRIGCHHKPLSEWQKNYKAIGRANGYTPQQIKEYGAHITYLSLIERIEEHFV